MNLSRKKARIAAALNVWPQIGELVISAAIERCRVFLGEMSQHGLFKTSFCRVLEVGTSDVSVS